jgi:DNA-binding FadR family transcriptional regulator
MARGFTVKQVRLAQSVADEIRSMILQDGLSSGDQLPSEMELMARFEVGRSTVREAMKQLQAENIVEIRRGKGSFVADQIGLIRDPLGLSFEEQNRVLRELMEVRLLLEPGIAGEAALRRDDGNLAAMERSIGCMTEAFAQGGDYQRYDYDFHLAMAESVHNSVLRRIYPVIFEAIAQGYQRTAHVHGSFEVALSYHRDIFAAIQRQDAEAARDCTRRHILQALADINRSGKGETQQ